MNPGYYGILPAAIRYDKRLKPMAKIMYSEITALSNKWGYCTANNRYFAELYEVSPATVSRWFSQLSKLGYIRVEVNKSKGNARKVYPNDQNVNTYTQKDQKGIDIKINTPIDKKINNNNTSINTTRIVRESAPTFSPEEMKDWENQISSLNATEPQKEKVAAKRKRFQPPTVEEIRAAMMEKISPDVARLEAEKFFNYYEANGWKVGRNKMQSWPHAVGGWLGRMDNYKKQTNGKNEARFGAAKVSEIEKAMAIRRARYDAV